MPNPPSPVYSNKPRPERELTTREKIILLESSKLNGHIFPPWQCPPDSSDFEDPKFTEDGDLSLSSAQLAVFAGWQRPADMATSEYKPCMGPNEAIDLVQDITTDCSVVASLCAASARLDLGQSDVITCNVFPRSSILEQPIFSPSGRYIVCLYFNGCCRKVTIDDRLPTSRTSRQLHVIDRHNNGLLWPALVEKAYLKVRGGYDFPGSNSGTDLWVMTGWIPEQLFMQSEDVVRSSLWRRLHSAFGYGDILITVGTGKLTPSEEEGMGLAGEHDYTVIDLKEHEGQPFVLIKNPWSEGTVWKGHLIRESAPLRSGEVSADVGNTSSRAPSTFRLETRGSGTFWMTFNDIFQSFESIYLNWNPKLFSYREDIHFTWDLSTSGSLEGSFVSNPQYAVHSIAGGTVWILLSRHFRTKDPVETETNDTDSTYSTEPGFISLYAFNNDGERVFNSDGAIVRGPYVDSPNTLLKLELPARTTFTIVVSEQTLPRSRNNFTLSSFSLEPSSLLTAREKYSHSTLHHGEWTVPTAGGNASCSSYHKNPQFRFSLAKASDVCLFVASSVERLPIHVKLMWAKGQRIRSANARDVVGDSGEYRTGSALAHIHNVQAGVYTLICSTFEQGQLGKFTLRVDTMSACEVRNVATETAGRFITKAQSAIFKPGKHRLLAPVISQRLNRLSVTARSGDFKSGSRDATGSPLSLFIEHGQGSSKQVLTSSGNDGYTDGRAEVQTPDIDVQPEMCAHGGIWVVIERLASPDLARDESVDIDLLSDGPLVLHRWVDG